MAQGNWPKGLVDDRYDFLFEGYDETKSMIETLFEVKNPTSGAYDQRTTVIGMGKLAQKSTENTSVTYRRPSEGFTAYSVYRDFDDGIELTRNEVDDFTPSKLTDLMKDTIKSWGGKLRLTEDAYAATLFTKGGFTAGHANFGNVIAGLISQNTDNLAYDAKPFFNRSDNTRTSKGGGTYYNAIAQPLNVSNYGTLYELITATNSYDERDEEISIGSMGRFALVFPPQLHDSAVQAIESEYLPDSGGDNNKNPWFNTCQLVQWDLLKANATAWYLGLPKQGLRFYRRGKPEIRMFRDEDNGSYKASIRARYGWMPWNFRFWGASNSPTS